jgi:hypothetical protein
MAIDEAGLNHAEWLRNANGEAHLLILIRTWMRHID